MGPLEVIDLAPGIEGALGLVQALESLQSEDFVMQGAVEAFVLAAALGVVRPGIDRLDTQLEQPYPKPGPVPVRGIAQGEPLSTKIASGRP
jgi:hypothetical protein